MAFSVVDCNSFTEAAEQMFISQSAISQQMKVLETELNVKLFNQKGHSFTLTPAASSSVSLVSPAYPGTARRGGWGV